MGTPPTTERQVWVQFKMAKVAAQEGRLKDATVKFLRGLKLSTEDLQGSSKVLDSVAYAFMSHPGITAELAWHLREREVDGIETLIISSIQAFENEPSIIESSEPLVKLIRQGWLRKPCSGTALSLRDLWDVKNKQPWPVELPSPDADVNHTADGYWIIQTDSNAIDSRFSSVKLIGHGGGRFILKATCMKKDVVKITKYAYKNGTLVMVENKLLGATLGNLQPTDELSTRFGDDAAWDLWNCVSTFLQTYAKFLPPRGNGFKEFAHSTNGKKVGKAIYRLL